MGRGVLSAVALTLGVPGLAACGEEPEVVAEPGATEGVAVTNARLMLPAVAGNPGVVYFDIANSGASNRMIRATSIAGAGSATMHTTGEEGMQETLQVMIEPGKTVKFEPGGTHVMANNLADTVKAGGTAEVTVTFVGGDTVVFPAEVRAAGDER